MVNLAKVHARMLHYIASAALIFLFSWILSDKVIADEIEADNQLITFSGKIIDFNGQVRYCRMIVYDPTTFETFYNNFVCRNGESFSVELPSGIYSVIYTPLTGFAPDIVPHEVANLDLTSSLQMDLPIPQQDRLPYLTRAGFTSNTLSADGIESIKLTVEGSIPSGSTLYYVNLDNNLGIAADDSLKAKYLLNDLGVGGDDVAGDGRYTSEALVYRAGFDVGAVSGLRRENRLGWVLPLSFQIDLNGINKGLRPQGDQIDAVVTIANDLIGLGDPLNLINDGIYYNRDIINIVRAPEDNAESDAEIIYQNFPDSFDFLFFLHNDLSGTNTNYFSSVRRDIEGIGRVSLDIGANYFSQARLKGIATFPQVRFEQPFNHELLHRWGLFMDSLFNTNEYGSHAGYCSNYGVHGGFDPGSFSMISSNEVSIGFAAPFGRLADTWEYSDLELYLMGLLPFESLRQDFVVLHDIVPLPSGTFEVSSISIVDKQEIIDVYGPRVPNHTSAQRAFRTGMVVISSKELTQSELDLYTYFSRTWSGEIPENRYLSFEKATGDRASMSTTIPLPTSVSTTESTGRNSVKIHPNPAGEFIEIKTDDLILAVHIRDLAGRLLVTYSRPRGQLSTSHLSPGVYLVQVHSSEFQFTSKLLIHK